MENKNNLLIVEMSSSALSISDDKKKDYVLEGIFGEIDVKNKNQRIYTESEYVPQIEALQQKIKSGKLLGELDHPSQFDISLKNVSHVIEELYYDGDKKQVRGKIRLLDTDAGKQAKALVDAGVPLQISSRAAGAVESNGTVKIKQLFTYDLVADPGFENAELTRVNESFGFSNDNGLYIYEINNTTNKQTQIIENQEMADFVQANDFNKYTEYLAKEIKSLKETIENKSDSSEVSEINDIKLHNDHIVESVIGIKEYVEYMAKKLDQNIQYTEHVAEKADQGIQYSESLAEKLDQNIQYTEHVAEKADQGIQYSESLAEKLDQGIQYSEHLAESITSVKEYANYLAEAHNENTVSAEKLIEYTNYLKENLQSVSEYAEYIAESINENLVVETEDVIGEEPTELENELEDKTPEVVDADGKEYVKATKRAEDDSEELETELESGVDGAAEEEISPVESYKSEISNKLSNLVEAATKKENENPTFFKIVSGKVQEKYNSLNEDAKIEVRRAVSKRGFMTEGQIESIIESANLIVENKNAAPFFIEAMPAEYKETWEVLSEGKKNQIAAQSKYFTLNTEYQVRNFWETRDLRESTSKMEKLEAINESKVEAPKGLGYDATGYGAELKKRFNK